MFKVTLITTLFALGLVGISAVHGEALQQLDTISYEIDTPDDYHDYSYDFISALLLGGDSIISVSSAGLWGRAAKELPWDKLIEGSSWIGQIVVAPPRMWRASTGDIFLFADRQLQTLNLRDGKRSFIEVWDVPKREGNSDHIEYLKNFSIAGDLLICGSVSWSDGPMLLVLQPTARDRGHEYRRIFPVPTTVEKKLRSVYIYTPSSIPAFDPKSNTIWVLIYGYKQIYRIDLDGKILDSLAIDRPDYIDPGPPKSWMRTQAVARDWESNWTPVRNFNYVNPGYLVLQYSIGSEVMGDYTVPLYGTAVWDTEGLPVELEIDQHWQLAGVQPDGRVIFARYDIKGDKRRIFLNVTRIIK